MYSIGRIWVEMVVVFLLCLPAAKELSAAESLPGNQAVQWRDTLYVKIADSAFINNSIVFSLKIYRPNAAWNNDDVLGDFDFYFSFSKKAFNGTIPSFESVLPQIDYDPGLPRKNLLFAYTHFYAGRYGIAARGDNNTPAAVKYNIPVGTWVDLCRVKIPMSDVDQNPRIVWDSIATGAMTAGGNPIILKLMGDVNNNPKSTVKAAGIQVEPQWQCQGEDIYLSVRDAITSGKGLTFTWRDSVAGETWNKLGDFDAASVNKTGSSKNNRYHFEVRGAGDTLVIKNAPGIVDSMSFNCTLTDASLGASITVDTVVYLRDSVWGYFALTTTTSPKYGMSDFTDTVKKCPEADAKVKFYLFGPAVKELQNRTEFGDKFTVYYNYLDEDQNTKRDSFEVKPSQLLSGSVAPSQFTPGSAIKTNIFGFNVDMKHTGKVWVESIKTDYCTNGASFPLYDTLFIEEVKGDISYDLKDISVSVNDKVALDTAMLVKKSYQIFLKTDPSPISGWLSGSDEPGEVYEYNSGDKAGDDTVYYSYKVGECQMKAYQRIEVVESYYLTMKVLLQGSYMGKNNLRDSMRCFYAQEEAASVQIFPRNNTFRLYSPYDQRCLLESTIRQIVDVKVKGTICDWIYLRLREAIPVSGGYNYGPVIDSVSAFCLNDGTVCGIDGKVLKFKNLSGKKVYIEVKHRNHLRVISKEPLLLPNTEPLNGNYLIEFTTMGNVYFGSDVLINVMGENCLVTGDINDDGFITVQDRNAIVKLLGTVFYNNDINQDNFITVQDRNFVVRNLGMFTRLP